MEARVLEKLYQTVSADVITPLMFEEIQTLLNAILDIQAYHHQVLNEIKAAHPYLPLEEPPNILNSIGPNKDTLLIAAISKKHIHVMQLLIAVHADVNARNEADFTPLMQAGNNIEIVQLLLNANADPNLCTQQGGHTALIYAGRFGYSQCIDALLEAKANVNFYDDRNKENTALDSALECGQLHCVRKLLEYKALIQHPDLFLKNLKKYDQRDAFVMEMLNVLSHSLTQRLKTNPDLLHFKKLLQEIEAYRDKLKLIFNTLKLNTYGVIDQALNESLPTEIVDLINSYESNTRLAAFNASGIDKVLAQVCDEKPHPSRFFKEKPLKEEIKAEENNIGMVQWITKFFIAGNLF